ncbi:MAG: dipeptidase PepE [Bacteroidales bacterium]|nr:dipeptidase PepE [Bacteroidales bacterium]
MRLLLISNSTNAGEDYLDYPKFNIKDFLGDKIKKTLFIPYAGVTFSFDDYVKKVQERFDEIGYIVDPIHRYDNPVEAVKNAEAIVVGGGNTFQLTKMLQDNGLIEAIREKVINGTPYVGWSAGSNIACPTIKTTNDMPILEPDSFNVFNLVPFQINPHYLDANPEGHAGETREMRLEEFLEVNPDIYVVGLREGTMLKVENNTMSLIGKRNARIFKKGQMPKELSPGENFSFLL